MVVLPVIASVGDGLTVTVTLEVEVHPLVVPVTVYVVVAEGASVWLLPDKLPGIQLYVAAPEAASVVLPLVQMPVLPVIATVGVGLTVTVTVEVAAHPLAATPVTVYVVVVTGLTVVLLPVIFPGCQV
jgi:hypothetical protein